MLGAGVVFLDFSAAFDLIDHELLLLKLSAYGFKNSVINFMRSYMIDRRQCVKFNGAFSDIETLQCGIPQGSCLGPLLYSIFVNDMPYVLRNAGIVMYADDTTIFASASSTEQVNKTLQYELTLISDWVTANKLKLSISKTKCMVLGSNYSLRSDQKLVLSLHGAAIEQVREAKLLGITIDETLSWSIHIRNIVSKMSKSISNIRKCACFLTDTTIKLVIQSLVLSHSDYCPAIWSGTSKEELAKLQLAQNRAARLAVNIGHIGCINPAHFSQNSFIIITICPYSINVMGSS